MLIAPTALILSLQSLHLTSTSDAPVSSLVRCWDECFDASSLAMIEKAGKERSHSFTSVFDRRCEAKSPLEFAIQSLLQELDGSSGAFVEYWWRDTRSIQSLEAHQNVDETLCHQSQLPVLLGSEEKIGLQRCPNYGHVLYVAVENVLAPTLVFEEEEELTKNTHQCGPPRLMKKVGSVPACSNRLLRFRGDCLHAVSYPPLEWLNVREKEDFSSSGFQ